jgi:hypothetical protein
MAYVRTLIGKAQRTIAISISPSYVAEMEQYLRQARTRGYRIVQSPGDAQPEDVETVLLLVDDREGMVGTLTPADNCQVVASTNPAFVAVLGRFFAPRFVVTAMCGADPVVTTTKSQPLGWLDWEERKQRRLLNLQHENLMA